MMQVVEVLRCFQLDVLDDDWVQGIYYSEFLEYGHFPAEYDSIFKSIDVRKAFRDIIRSIDKWLSSEEGNEAEDDKTWAFLSNYVARKKLLAILGYYLDDGTKNVTDKKRRNNALLAARVYYKLIAIPGYKAYNIYHSQLFAHSLACLGYPKALCDKNHSSKDLTNEVNSVIKELKHFVSDLKVIVKPLQLKPNEINFDEILSNLVDITGGAIVCRLNVDKIELLRIFDDIYEIINILLLDLNGEPNPSAIGRLFKCILPKLIGVSMDCKNPNTTVRAQYVTYTSYILTRYGKAAFDGYVILLQNLCIDPKGMEKAEVRQGRMSLVLGLMSLLPHKLYHNFVKWILTLSTVAKVCHRQLALEMLYKLLCNEAEEEDSMPVQPAQEAQAQPIDTEMSFGTGEIQAGPATGNNEGQPNTDKDNPTNEQPTATESKIESEIQAHDGVNPILGNMDEATTAATGNETHMMMQANVEPQATDRAGTTSEATPNNTTTAEAPPVNTPAVGDGSSQHTLDLTEDDEPSELLRARTHTVPHAEVLRALYARVHDTASTIRARAFYVLADCLNGQYTPHYRAMRELIGEGTVSRLMAAAARGVCDERAAVRRAAAALVHRSLILPSNPMPAADDLAILVGLCRDASVIVRCAAINYLGELAVKRPCEAVFDAWATGPMHQISDPETKTQELVMALTKQLLMDRLHKYSAGGAGNEDPIPWMFLDAISRHNMRPYLRKACLLLAKSSKGVNTKLVDVASTHLGTSDATRDLLCLILLTSVARHVDYSNVEFSIEYYHKLIDDKLHDTEPRLLSLTLELLTAWVRWMKRESRSKLRDHVVTRLTAQDDGCRLQAVTLAAHLDPSNLIWANELMQLSQQRVMAGADIEEWLRAVDLSVVASERPSPQLVKKFLLALIDPPKAWDEEKRGICMTGCGRLCFRSRQTAVVFAPHIAAVLRDKSSPLAPRHNAVLILADICIRYTSIVEPLLDDVCACLHADCEPSLRREASRSITKLLLAGYLKLKTPLYYRYCALLADEDHEVRQPVEHYVSSSLPPDTICMHFVDCILHYNKNTTESMAFDARQLVYDVMLQRVSLVQRLNLQCRIAREVLEHAADVADEGPADQELPAPLNAALLDAITILCGPRMKLPRKKPPKDGDAPDLDDLQERVTTNILSYKITCMVAEVLVPAVMRLNQQFLTRGGQLAAYLVKMANDLFNDYQTEIAMLMEDDRDLMTRIERFGREFNVRSPLAGNSRNLVTASTTHDPETPRAPRKRPARSSRSAKKRKINI